jgi:hypothetical protein
MPTVAIYFTEEEYDNLSRQAKAESKKPSEFIKEIAKFYLATEKP